MAAYNGGPGRVSRQMKKQKTNDFWKLRLKRQTMDYVPLIMAATIIAKEPEKYGFSDIVKEPEVVWDEVVINRCLDFLTLNGVERRYFATYRPELFDSSASQVSPFFIAIWKVRIRFSIKPRCSVEMIAGNSNLKGRPLLRNLTRNGCINA